MAIANSDGSIVLTTIVDPSGIKSFQSSLKKLAGSLVAAFSINQIVKFSNAAGQLATQTEASVQRLVDIYGSASDSVGDFIDANARALGMSKAAAASFSSVYGNLFSVWADQATNAELTNRYLNMTAVVASKTGRTVEDVQERVRSGLLGNTEAIEDLGIFVNVKTIEMTDAFQRTADGKSWEQLDAYTQQQIRSMAILEQATKKYGDEVADTSATIRNRYKAAYEDFQNSWGNIVNTVLLPVLETLTQIFDIATKGLNALSNMSGQILENVELQEENTDKTAENIEEQTKNQKELNKELKKSLAGFDDIQILSAGTAETTQPPPDFDNITGGGGTAPDGSIIEETSQKIQDLAKVVAKSMIAIGCVLLATGNIGWGIGLIIAGAMAEGIVEASVGDGSSFEEIADKISNAITISGVVAIILGILLCMASMWGLGIGLIIKGAVAVAGSVALNWDSIKEALIEQQNKVTLAGGLMVVLGIFMCVAGMWGLGIGAIILGATLLVTEVVLNWDAIRQAIKEQSGKVALADALLIAIGILMCVAGMLPIGIGLIAAGVVGLAPVIAINWNAIVDFIKSFVSFVIEWIKSYGLLVLGIILCLTAAGIPLGIALILKWVKDDGEKGYPLTNAIVDKVKEVWNAVKGFWNKHIAPVFTLEFWKNLAIKCGNGLIAGFEGAINGIIWAFESMINWIVDGLNKISIDIPNWVPGIGGETWGVNIPRAELGRVSIPRLARGTVVPPNKRFIAELGDNTKEHEIVSPISTMKQAFLEAMNESAAMSQQTKEERYYLGETELMSIMYKLVKGGERLNGKSFIQGAY